MLFSGDAITHERIYPITMHVSSFDKRYPVGIVSSRIHNPNGNTSIISEKITHPLY